MTSKFWAVVAGALMLAATACSGNSGKVSVSAKATTNDTTTVSGLDLGNGVLVNRVRIAVRKVSLDGATTAAPDAGTPDAGSDDGAGHALVADHGGGDGANEDDDDATEVRVGPFLIDLSGSQLTGPITQVFDGDVPAGTYTELKFVVGPVSVDKAGSNAVLAAMNGRSVIVDGTLNGAAFTFESALHALQKKETTITVGASSSNVTLSIDPTSWFKAADGSLLDPTSPTAKSQIEDHIKASIGAFCDHDRDGKDDATEHGGGHDGSGHG